MLNKMNNSINIINTFSAYLGELVDYLSQEFDEIYLVYDILAFMAHDKYVHTNEYATRANNLQMLKYLTYIGQFKEVHYDNIIYIAAQVGHIDIVKYILQLGYDVHANCDSILYIALTNGYLCIIEYILGLYPYLKQDKFILMSSACGYLDIVKYFVKLGVSSTILETAFMYAVEYAHLDVVAYLYSINVDVHTRDDHAIKLAADMGHFNIVKYLVNIGANIYAEHNLPFRCASLNGHRDIVIYLINHVNNTPLSLKRQQKISDSQEDMMDDQAENTLVEEAQVKCGQVEYAQVECGQVVEYAQVEEAQADLTRAQIHGWNTEAFLWAANMGQIDTIRYMVHIGVQLNLEEALQGAALNGHLDVVHYLVDCGADIHAGDERALIYAAREGHLEVIKYLLSCSVHSEHTLNTALRDAIYIADSMGHHHVVTYLNIPQ